VVSFVHVYVWVIAVPLRLRGGVFLASVACGRTSDAAALGVLGLTNPDRSPMLLHLGSFTLVGTQNGFRLLSLAQCGGGLGCSMRYDWLPT
jgi:hypothetical protein